MAEITVKEVASRSEQKQFVDLAWTINASDPNWIPPLLANQRELLNYKPHPFYDDAEIQTFLAFRGGKPVGRIAAIVNRGHNRRYNEQRGFFGFFECVDDQSVANALFDAARNWLTARGMDTLRGPTNPSLNYECGLLIDGFDTPPFFMMTHNPAYYDRLIQTYGFEKSQDMYAFWGESKLIYSLDKKLSFILEESKSRFGITLRRLDKSRFLEEVRMFLNIYNQSLGGTWGFVPLSEREIEHLAKGLKMLIEPELTAVAEVEGKPIGAVFGLLDYNPRIKAMNGRLFPLGFLKLLTGRRKLRRLRVLSANVTPEYQKWGVGLVVLGELVPTIIRWPIDEVEFSWVLESNHLSAKTLKKGGAQITKTYRIYDYQGR